jgi:hypothetical protein
MDKTALTGWMYSSTIDDGTPGAPWVAQILGGPCMGALAPKNGCKMAIGRGCFRPPPGPETAQKRLKLAIKTGYGTRNCYLQLDRPAWVSGNVFCTPSARKPPPTALPGAKKSRNTQTRYKTIRCAMDFGGRRSPRGAPTPPHGRFGPRQRLVHHRGHVGGPCTQLYHPHLGTWAPTAVRFGRGRPFYP